MMLTLAPPAGMLVFVYTMVCAGISDLTTMKIRNGLILALLGAYAALAPLAGFASREIGLSALIAIGVLLVGFLCFARGWIGGGDAKLAAVTVLWFGAEHTPTYLLLTALFGGAFTLVLLRFRMFVLPVRLQLIPWIARLHAPETGVPYGVAMVLAALILFPLTPWMTRLS